MRKKKLQLYAASGSCFDPEKIIVGIVDKDYSYISSCFEDSTCNEGFWDRLRAYAKSQKAFVKLMY